MLLHVTNVKVQKNVLNVKVTINLLVTNVNLIKNQHAEPDQEENVKTPENHLKSNVAQVHLNVLTMEQNSDIV